jgi:hypothetical protein
MVSRFVPFDLDLPETGIKLRGVTDVATPWTARVPTGADLLPRICDCARTLVGLRFATAAR